MKKDEIIAKMAALMEAEDDAALRQLFLAIKTVHGEKEAWDVLHTAGSTKTAQGKQLSGAWCQ